MAVLRTFTTLWHHIMGTWSTETELLFGEENLDLDATDFLWTNPLSDLMNLTKYGIQRRLGRIEHVPDIPDELPIGHHESVEGEQITRILAMCRSRKSTNPRHKVYGLLGLLPQRFVSTIHPNYKMSPGEMFTNFATAMITYAESLTFLNQATYNRDRSLPSWVPNWEISWEAAGHERHRELPSDPSFLYKTCLSQWRNMCGVKMFNWSSRSHYIAGGALFDAYWKTLFGGILYNGDNPDRKCRSSDRNEYMKFRVRQVFGGDIPKVANDSILLASTGRRMLVCQKGYIGLGPSHTEAKDVVYVIKGSPVPYILRPVKDKNQSDTFKFIGECYIHGIMNGEAVERDSQDQKMSMSDWLRFKVCGGKGPDLADGRRFLDWISLE